MILRWQSVPDQGLGICFFFPAILAREKPLSPVQVFCRTELLNEKLNAIAKLLGTSELLESLPGSVSQLNLFVSGALSSLPFSAIPFRGSCLQNHMTLIRVRASSDLDRSLSPAKRAASGSAVITHFAATSEIHDQSGRIRAWHFPEITGPAKDMTKISSALNRLSHLKKSKSRGNLPPQSAAAAFYAVLEQHKVVHVHGHGQFFEDVPSESGIVLSQDEGCSEMLSLRWLASQNQGLDADIVGLSACFSADSLSVADWQEWSLPLELCRLGVRAVATSLWQLDANLARAQFGAFYNALASTKHTGEAAQRARAAVIEAGQNRARHYLTHPAFWSGFCVWRSID